MSNIKKFSSRKEVTEFLKEKDIDTSNWSEVKWLSLNKGQAEIHMQALAEAMWDAYNESTPKELKEGEWHIPFGDKMQDRDIMQYIKGKFSSRTEVEEAVQKFKLKVSTARCARLSYVTFDGEIDYEKDIALHDRLLEDNHFSCFEHCAKAMSEKEYDSYVRNDGSVDTYGWCRNFKGFIQYRHLLENKS